MKSLLQRGNMDRPAMVAGAQLVSGQEIENLPSYGISTIFNLADEAETATIMKRIREGKELSQKGEHGDEMEAHGSSASPAPEQGRIQVFIQDGTEERQDLNEYGFKFAAGTAPIWTVDESQIKEDIKVQIKDDVTEKPVLHVKMNTSYMRFRYMSEKCPKTKGKKSTRQYDTDDTEKQSFAEVWVDNYTGTGKIVAYCVDSTGKLHPYNLFGDSCHQGVYVTKYQFRPGKIAKLKKVSVTTPKAKEYKLNLKDQLAYLQQVGIQKLEQCDYNNIQDKQIVYVMFTVILDDYAGEVLSQISTPLQNKKKGKEFLIDDVEPVSAPASGFLNCNIGKNRVMLHVTENTAFPSEVGVKIRERDDKNRIVWETEGLFLTVVKQCVVKFVPPAYKNPNTRDDVEVEICLYDKKTHIETDPFTFVYKGSDNCIQNLGSKSKKRKLNEDVDWEKTLFMTEKMVKDERKILSALRTIPPSSSARSSTSSSPENSLGYIQESQQMQPPSLYTTDPLSQNEASYPQPMATGSDEREVSLREQRTADGQLPFTSYTGQGQIVGHSMFNTGFSQTAQQPTSPQLAGFRGRDSESVSANQLTSLNLPPVVTSVTSGFGTSQQTATYQSANTTIPAVSVNSNMTQQQTVQTKGQSSQTTLISDEDRLFLAQQGLQLPKLGPNQMFALIDGHIFVVNDDTADQKSNPAPEPATNNSPAIIQNIGQQQVIIQHVAPQHPTTETEPAGITMPNTTAVTQTQSDTLQNWSQGAFQTQTAGNITQITGNPQNVQASLPYVEQQQQQLQQQQALQLAQQIATAAGIDLNQPNMLQSLLQQIAVIQSQPATSDTGAEFASASNLNDDDIEIDGDPNTDGKKTNDSGKEQLSHTEQTKKKLRASSKKERDRSMQDEIFESVSPGEDDTASRIPTFVNEVIIGEDSSDSVSYGIKQTEKRVDYRLKNGSFGNGETTDEEEDV